MSVIISCNNCRHRHRSATSSGCQSCIASGNDTGWVQAEWTREEKIAFLKSGEEELHIPYGDLSQETDEKLDELVEELDWLWK